MKKLSELFASIIKFFIPSKEFITVKRELQMVTRKGTGRPLDDLAMISGLTKKQVRYHVKLCGMKYQEALKYYLYFNRMPDIDKAIVIRHFGVDNLIAQVDFKNAQYEKQ